MTRRRVGAVMLAVVLLGGTATALDAVGRSDDASPTGTPPTALDVADPASGHIASSPSAGPGAQRGRTGPVPGPTDSAVTDPGDDRPVRISVRDLNVDATMTDLGIRRDGAIEVPSDPQQVGWLDTTPAPGQQGPAVLAGHLDSETGPAVFFDLASLAVGAEISITRQDGSSVQFTVDGVRTYAQDEFPTADVYGPVPGPALRLITCGGDYDAARGGYQDNVVVYAS